jgi:hypothetical protein
MNHVGHTPSSFSTGASCPSTTVTANSPARRDTRRTHSSALLANPCRALEPAQQLRLGAEEIPPIRLILMHGGRSSLAQPELTGMLYGWVALASLSTRTTSWSENPLLEQRTHMFDSLGSLVVKMVGCDAPTLEIGDQRPTVAHIPQGHTSAERVGL